MHGIPVEYSGPRKAELLVRFLRKFVAPDISILESDSAIISFIETAGTSFPIFIGFGIDESLIAEFAGKYKKKAWFSLAKDFSEEVMVAYDFDKTPALVCLHPSYGEKSVFYGPFEGLSNCRLCKTFIVATLAQIIMFGTLIAKCIFSCEEWARKQTVIHVDHWPLWMFGTWLLCDHV